MAIAHGHLHPSHRTPPPADRRRTALWATLYALAVPGSLVVLAPLILLARNPPEDGAPAWYQFLGLIPLLPGVALVCWCTRDLVVRGRGTPAPTAPPRVLVVEGPYRWSRNPMYLAILCLLAGIALATWSRAVAVYLACTWAGMQLFLVLYEEPSLRRRFGAAYERYCAAVPRWLGRGKGITP